MIIDIFYWISATLSLLGSIIVLFLNFYLYEDKIINNRKYDKWYKFHNIVQILAWVFFIICASLLVVKKFI
jgi:hypothetical protein